MDTKILEQAKNTIYSVNLDSVINRLVKVDGWILDEAKEAVKQYRNYLYLRRKYPYHNLPPSKDIDEAWHAHVLHTKEYRDFCKKAFNNEEDQYLDHHPHLAKEGSEAKLAELFEKTQNLYKQEFDEYIYQITGQSFIRKWLNKIGDALILRFPKLSEVLEK